ncbi:uncharacterized protein LOC111685784 [Lucilia cuprina]|uniref:uncharacterized protein LOC111685784 n=1 Tax=Lucilia cuprina TaxID=7375 RepID=UPI001F05092E|nr:uncharacterized protein LOC111685784 [Lucilia cuprina]
MYKITHFDKKLCHLLRHHLDFVDENMCDFYSIWNFCPRTRWKALKTFFAGKYLCRSQYFPFIYWLVLVISIMGSIYSFSEFSSLFWGTRKQLNMWRQRTFYVLPPSVLRKCRLVGALIMLYAWLLLWYAVVKVSPSNMTPWLIINMLVLGCDLIIWITEVFSGVCKLELQTLFSFTLMIVIYLFVRCVQRVFQNAIEINDVEDLRLWKSF